MAERRMFAKTIIDSDAFLDMPLTAQALYFHLSMRADDDGFINNPKKIMRMVGCSEDDMRILLAKSFIIGFESGIIVIKHWKIHNYIRSDRYKPTVYVEEKSQLEVKTNTAYRLSAATSDTVGIPDGYQMDTQVRLGKVSIGKVRLAEEEGSQQQLPELNSEACEIVNLWNQQSVTQNIDGINPLTKRESDTRLCINGNVEQYMNTIRSLDRQAFFKESASRGKLLKYDWFCNPNNYQKVVEGNYTEKYKPAVKQTSFNNFQQRNYDFGALEKKMMGL